MDPESAAVFSALLAGMREDQAHGKLRLMCIVVPWDADLTGV